MTFRPFLYPGVGAKTRSQSAFYGRSTMPSAASWSSVAYNGSTFAALVTGTTAAATSTDGATWTARTSAGAYNWSGMYAVGGTFCAVSNSGYAQTSTDGISWTLRTLPRSHNYRLYGYFGGTQPAFLAVGDQYTAYSSNGGVTWTEGTLPESYQYSGVAYNGTMWMAAAENLGGWVTTSTNGTTWSAKKYIPELFDIDRVDKKGFYLSGPFVIGSDFYLFYHYNHRWVLKSSDGNTWTKVIRNNYNPYSPSGEGGEVFFSPPYASYASDGTTFTVINVYNSYGQCIFTTNDFLTWRRKSSPRNDTYGYAFQEKINIAIGGGKLAAVFPAGSGQSACVYGTYSSAASRP